MGKSARLAGYDSGEARLALRLVFCALPLAAAAVPVRAAACDPPVTNPIVCENSKTGNPATEWDVVGAGDASIQGFATDISVNHGETVHFKIATDATAYHLDIYRLGYYGGNGARLVAGGVLPTAALPQAQPGCLNDPTTGLNDCGNWVESASWTVPVNAVSGVYIARLVREDTLGASHVVFVVRDDEGHSPLLFQTSDTAWQAYNQYGGNSLYVGEPATNPSRAYKVSYNRPFTTRATTPEDWLFNAEYPMIRWLEANGYNVSYFTGVDSDRRGAQIQDHHVFLSVGHDEYWSGGQRANVETARAAGEHLAFFSGNEVFWKTRWEASIDPSATPYRTLVCYKETHAGAKIDPSPEWTGTWRDNRPIDPSPSPENALTGNIFTVNCCTYAMTVGPEDGKLRLWRNTSVANLGPEDTATLPDGTLGYEWNEDLDNGARPAGTFRLSSTTLNVPERILDQGSTYGPGTATHSLTIYRHPSGALVFGAGTVQWSWGLDAHHDRGSNATDASMQQATVNLLADMGVQPGTLQSGLVAAAASTDATPPTSQVTAPAPGANLPSGSPFLIAGTAADSGGLVGGVEVSTDGGTTWHRANGRSSWSYAWTPGATGNAVIRSRAADDSGNIETPSAGVSVTIGAPSCPCSIWNDSFTPANLDPNDHQSVELGVKFRSDTAGFITGIRFYKGPQNTGTHVGHLWTSGGGQLGAATFTNEGASGWQQVSFSSAIPISANTTYVASYFAPAGEYAFDGGYFASAFDDTPLHALADGTDGPTASSSTGAASPPPPSTRATTGST
ncbi:MAG TPA: N,N-dimethylformamidase beta subunit family domain-containing protein [Thermoanaerobaculia bacterium]|nr:N,N-dimethylformamidase beta subunit family domain-containing protein [Thermoanaerobaculia bacterium]